ncbi:hypothetical protein BJX99DRAFT_256635 [Aspergillus californicus]
MKHTHHIWFPLLVPLVGAYIVSPSGDAAPGTTEDCTRWVEYSASLTCGWIQKLFGMTEAQFEEWNPIVTESGSGCTLLPDLYYCVQVNFVVISVSEFEMLASLSVIANSTSTSLSTTMDTATNTTATADTSVTSSTSATGAASATTSTTNITSEMPTSAATACLRLRPFNDGWWVTATGLFLFFAGLIGLWGIL